MPEKPRQEAAQDLSRRVTSKYRQVWDNLSPREQRALSLYFLPHDSPKGVLGPTRPRVVKWYCPFATQSESPTRHRYCIDVYTGCTHACIYCHVRAHEPREAGPKEDFARLLTKDMVDLEEFGVPPAPVYLSNRTDPFQEFEAQFGHTRLALESILQHRNRFTTITILTKNPRLPLSLGYLDLFRELGRWPTHHPRKGEFERQQQPGLVVQVTLAFWKDEAAKVYDPGAPSVVDRIEGLLALQEAGIPIVLRIDPLFLHQPLATRPRTTLATFGLHEVQALDDLEDLVCHAKELGVRHVVYSPAKIVLPRDPRASPEMVGWLALYVLCTAPGGGSYRDGSWQLPDAMALRRVVAPFLQICARHKMAAKSCKHDLIETP